MRDNDLLILVGITSYGLGNMYPGVQVMKMFLFFANDAISNQARVSSPSESNHKNCYSFPSMLKSWQKKLHCGRHSVIGT